MVSKQTLIHLKHHRKSIQNQTKKKKNFHRILSTTRNPATTPPSKSLHDISTKPHQKTISQYPHVSSHQKVTRQPKPFDPTTNKPHLSILATVEAPHQLPKKPATTTHKPQTKKKTKKKKKNKKRKKERKNPRKPLATSRDPQIKPQSPPPISHQLQTHQPPPPTPSSPLTTPAKDVSHRRCKTRDRQLPLRRSLPHLAPLQSSTTSTAVHRRADYLVSFSICGFLFKSVLEFLLKSFI